jgi:hypothetical protein
MEKTSKNVMRNSPFFKQNHTFLHHQLAKTVISVGLIPLRTAIISWFSAEIPVADSLWQNPSAGR